MTGKRRILLYIHGGLNTQTSTIRRAVKLVKDIEGSGQYPIFINWRSSLPNAYGNHLLFRRQGKDWRSNPAGWATSPLILAGDAARAMTHAVPSWIEMFRSDWTSAHYEKDKDAGSCVDRDGLRVCVGKDLRRASERKAYAVAWALTVPTKLATSPIIEGLGAPSWESMLRASDTVFRTTERRNLDGGAPERRETVGGLGMFLDDLEALTNRDDQKGHWDITLIGHSMGAILVNRILRENPELPIGTIVYFAGACTLDDYFASVPPFLERHPETRMVHHVLHRSAEVRDRTTALGFGWIDFSPRGSLLVWIDNFLSNPRTYRGRTAGRMANLIDAQPDHRDWPQDVRHRISIREYSVGGTASGSEPQHHGNFGNITFWNPDCLTVSPKSPEFCYKKKRDTPAPIMVKSD